MGAAAIQLWLKARYGVRVPLIVVQHTFGGFLNFYPHLHVLISAGGLQERNGRWIRRLKYNELTSFELMCAWRYAVVSYIAEALSRAVLTSEFSAEQLQSNFEIEHVASGTSISPYDVQGAFLEVCRKIYSAATHCPASSQRYSADRSTRARSQGHKEPAKVMRQHSKLQSVRILERQVPDRCRVQH